MTIKPGAPLPDSIREMMPSDEEHMEAEDAMKREENLRKRSDDLLLASGYEIRQTVVGDTLIRDLDGRIIPTSQRPHPYANAQDAIDLAEAMGLKVAECDLLPSNKYSVRLYTQEYAQIGPTVAEAISAAIAEAVK